MQPFGVGAARLFVGVVTLALVVFGVREMHAVISVGQPTILQYVFFGLFALNFTWVSFAFAQALMGFFGQVCARGMRGSPAPDAPPAINTAILAPVYNEDPRRVAAGLTAMAKDLADAAPGKFAIFVLSDTNSASSWLAEEATLARVIADAPEGCRIYYRHRAINTERKAGNIGDWVQRWGGAYEAMVVLDADSLMDAKTLITLANRLQARPDLGLIQTLPRIIRARSLYARMQQFANRLYGPIYGWGLALWHGRSSNFWGHNAIIRTRAFAEAARLPELPGVPPLGGHILSHDFAEAALMRRAGWGVRIDADLVGTYEETPPSLTDVIVRDRRWAQGNLQHVGLVFAKGLTMATRVHLFSGIMSYVSAVLWLLLIITGLALALQATMIEPDYFVGPSLFPLWPVFDAERAVTLFFVSLGVVLGPKVLGWLAAMVSWRTLMGFGGPVRLTVSVIVEVILSALYAPIMMLAQTRIVASVLLGRDAGWRPQQREDGAVPLAQLFRAHGWHMAIGVGASAAAWLINPGLFWWLAPVTAGLTLSVALSAASAAKTPGAVMRTLGVWRTPEERTPPPIAAALTQALATTSATTVSAITAPLDELRRNQPLADWHTAQLASDVDPRTLDEVTLAALAKADFEPDAAALDQWLTPRQMTAFLAHPRLKRWLTGL